MNAVTKQSLTNTVYRIEVSGYFKAHEIAALPNGRKVYTQRAQVPEGCNDKLGNLFCFCGLLGLLGFFQVLFFVLLGYFH